MKERETRDGITVFKMKEAATPQQLLVFYENKGPFLLHWQELRQTHTILSPAGLRSPLNKQLKAHQLRVLLSVLPPRPSDKHCRCLLATLLAGTAACGCWCLRNCLPSPWRALAIKSLLVCVALSEDGKLLTMSLFLYILFDELPVWSWKKLLFKEKFYSVLFFKLKSMYLFTSAYQCFDECMSVYICMWIPWNWSYGPF